MCWFSEDLPFEFKALELVLELSCLSLDAQVCHIVFSNGLVSGSIVLLIRSCCMIVHVTI